MDKFFKIIVAFFSILMISVSAFAYNPIANADNFFNLTSPDLLTGSAGVAGGALHNLNASSIVANPALIAGVQRWTIDVDYTAIIPGVTSDSYAQACQLGLVIPSKYGVGSFLFQGVFSDNMATMDFGNTITFRGAYAKDLTNRLYVGVGLFAGWGYHADFAVALDLGFWYDLRNVWFMKNARWAMSFTSIGKTYNSYQEGLYYGTLKTRAFPSPFTLKVGYAADLIDIKNFKWGFSADASLPSFQNAIFDIGMQFLICDIVKLTTGWQANVRELANGENFSMPVAGVSVNFKFEGTKKDDSFMAKQGWKKNEASVAVAYRNLTNGANAISAGVTAILGQEDTVAPEIILWEENK